MEGVIQSPNYPFDYDNNLYCVYHIWVGTATGNDVRRICFTFTRWAIVNVPENVVWFTWQIKGQIVSLWVSCQNFPSKHKWSHRWPYKILDHRLHKTKSTKHFFKLIIKQITMHDKPHKVLAEFHRAFVSSCLSHGKFSNYNDHGSWTLQVPAGRQRKHWCLVFQQHHILWHRPKLCRLQFVAECMWYVYLSLTKAHFIIIINHSEMTRFFNLSIRLFSSLSKWTSVWHPVWFQFQHH